MGKVGAHLCLTLIIKELKFSVEHGRVVTTLNILFSGFFSLFGMTCLGNTKKVVLSRCRLLINMKNAVKLLYC